MKSLQHVANLCFAQYEDLVESGKADCKLRGREIDSGRHKDVGEFLIVHNPNDMWTLLSEHPYVSFIEDGGSR